MAYEPRNPAPRVSVGILTRNAGALFARVIDALAKQRTDWPFEIVVLDSASKDGTDKYAESRGCRVIPYRPAQFRFGTARDTLFENCRGQAIVTISQDVVPGDQTWLAKMVAPILDGRADATVGEQRPAPGEYAFYWDYNGSWMRSVAIRFDQAFGRIAISGSNLALRRSTWERLRFGDVEAIEDRVMQVKLFKSGCKMLQVRDAVSLHGHDYSWKQLNDRFGSFAMGWAELGWPYTMRRLLRDLVQPSRYIETADAFIHRRLRSWKELFFPFAMCFMQWRGSRKVKRSVFDDSYYVMKEQ
ncbi:MAG TPA: glycosyltransferase family 2 protein [Tepidisphaeraceae bacterium]|jgi:rhamnosyltransferase